MDSPFNTEQYAALLNTKVEDKNTGLYILYMLIKKAALSNMFSSSELAKLNECIEKFPGLEKIVV